MVFFVNCILHLQSDKTDRKEKLCWNIRKLAGLSAPAIPAGCRNTGRRSAPKVKGGVTMNRPLSQWESNYLHRQQCINDYAKHCCQPRLRPVDKILVYHPDEHRRYLQQHPCAQCRASSCCDLPCAVYLQWYTARVQAAGVRAGM